MRMKDLFFDKCDNMPRAWWIVVLVFIVFAAGMGAIFGPIINERVEKRTEFYQNRTAADLVHVKNIRRQLEANPPAGSLIVGKERGVFVIHTPTRQGALITYWYPSLGHEYRDFLPDVDDFTLFNIERIVLPSDSEYGSFAHKLLSGL